MNAQEKQAWFILSIVAVTTALTVALLTIFGLKLWAFAAISLFGFAGLAPRIGRKEARAGTVEFDERDKAIANSANLGGFAVFWAAFVIAVMTPFFVYGPQGSVTLSTPALTLAVPIAMALVFGVRSIIMIVLYKTR